MVEQPNRMHILVDSGAYAHVCPAQVAVNEPIEEMPERTAISADGRPIRVLGARRVRFRLANGIRPEKKFRVTN
eukprot:1559296-Heterocapsa_arctica.AAC.1